jgi:prefoldin alpha subunit
VNEEEIKQALAALELCRGQAQSLAEQQNLVQFSLEEYTRARETLAKWKDAPQDAEILVPVGGNSFVFAKAGSNSKALVGVGTGLTVEKPIQEALDTFEARIKELTEGLKKVSENRAVAESRANQLAQMVQGEYDRLQQQG